MNIPDVGTPEERVKNIILLWGKKHMRRFVKREGRRLFRTIGGFGTICGLMEVFEKYKMVGELEIALVKKVQCLAYASVARGDGMPYLNILFREVRKEVEK